MAGKELKAFGRVLASLHEAAHRRYMLVECLGADQRSPRTVNF